MSASKQSPAETRVDGVGLFAALVSALTWATTGLFVRALDGFASMFIVATVTPSLFYAVAASRLAAVTTSATRLLTPVLAALLAAVLIGELPAATFWPGSALVLVGLWVLLRG